jgi:lipopolysaccharide transport system ATP-binding protein
MSSEIVIRAEQISKQYRLGVINHGTLYRDLQSWWAKMRGRPDPNTELSDITGQRHNPNRLVGDIFHALEDVSFEVNRGDIVGVIGRNGAGKSTLLKIISRITSPTSGYIGIKGRIASLLEVGTGFHPELTGRENVYLNGAILGMTRREVSSKFEQIVEFAEIGEFIDTPVKRYSSGMYVRLAFSVAAHLEPEILLVDEVLAVGDYSFQNKCLQRMQEIGNQGRTIMFVSHNLTAISSMCSSTILIDNGMLVQKGPTIDVISKYLNQSGSYHFAEHLRVAPEADAPVFIKRVSVKNMNDNLSGKLELTEEFYVEVEYQINRKISGLIMGLQIIADDGYITVINLSDAELVPERLQPRSLGTYISRVTIPSHILNTGNYRVRVGLSTRFSIYDVVEDVTFEVIDSIGIVQFLGWERKNSLLGMQLPWVINHVPDSIIV